MILHPYIIDPYVKIEWKRNITSSLRDLIMVKTQIEEATPIEENTPIEEQPPIEENTPIEEQTPIEETFQEEEIATGEEELHKDIVNQEEGETPKEES